MQILNFSGTFLLLYNAVTIYTVFLTHMTVSSENRDSLCQMPKEKGLGRTDSHKVHIVCLTKRGSSAIGEEFRTV